MKVWKTRSVLGEGYGSARSEDTWIPTETSREKVNSVGWNDQFACSATNDGFVRWADVGQGSARVATQVRIPDAEGPPVYLHCNGPMAIVRTHHGVLYGIDLRVGASEGPLKRHDIWRKKFQESHGLVTSSAIDPWQQSWMVIGNNSGQKNLVLYDLRFKEEVLRWESPHQNTQPNRVWANPVSRQECPEVFVGFSMHGEISTYELSAQPLRKRVFWTGGAPILSYSAAVSLNKIHIFKKLISISSQTMPGNKIPLPLDLYAFARRQALSTQVTHVEQSENGILHELSAVKSSPPRRKDVPRIERSLRKTTHQQLHLELRQIHL